MPANNVIISLYQKVDCFILLVKIVGSAIQSVELFESRFLGRCQKIASLVVLKFSRLRFYWNTLLRSSSLSWRKSRIIRWLERWVWPLVSRISLWGIRIESLLLELVDSTRSWLHLIACIIKSLVLRQRQISLHLLIVFSNWMLNILLESWEVLLLETSCLIISFWNTELLLIICLPLLSHRSW